MTKKTGAGRHLSIKMKLLLLLVTLTVLILVSYSILMIRDFRLDKLAYVYDTILMNTKSTASLVLADVQSQSKQIRNLTVQGLQADTRPAAEKWFRSDGAFQTLAIYELKNGQFEPVWALKQGEPSAPAANDASATPTPAPASPSAAEAAAPVVPVPAPAAPADRAIEEAKSFAAANADYLSNVLAKSVLIKMGDDLRQGWTLGIALKSSDGQRNWVTIARLKRPTFVDPFSRSQSQDSYLLNEDNSVLLGPAVAGFQMDDAMLAALINEAPHVDGQRSGVFESKGEAALGAYAEVGAGGMRVFSVISKEAALRAANMLVRKAAFFLIFLIAVTVVISVLSTNRLTESLKGLHSAILEISKGNFNVRVPVQSRDEVGDVAEGFNKMSTEITRLIGEREDKIRMEEELKTAQLVQSLLFPEPRLRGASYEIKGTYRPAGECSGDLWNYFVRDHKLYFFIADATGHGVPAALLTSAARSAASMLSKMDNLTVAQGLSLMNDAIFETTQGKMQMTAFFGCLDTQSGELSFGSASHEPPYWLRAAQRPLKRKDLSVLDVDPGARLGERGGSKYPTSSVKLQKGDVIFFYTDGLPELYNDQDEMLGARKVEQSLVKIFNESGNPQKLEDELQRLAEEHRQQAPLRDDITFGLLEIQA